MEDHEVTAAEHPLILSHKLPNGETKDKEFLAVAFSDRDWDTLDAWIQSEVITSTRNSLRFSLEEAEESGDEEEVARLNVLYEQDMQAASKAAISVSINEPSGRSIVDTPRGSARMFWMMCRKQCPKNEPLLFSDCIKLCRDVRNISEIMRAFAKANTGVVAEPKSDPDIKIKEKVPETVGNV